jgi:hypothetical protein
MLTLTLVLVLVLLIGNWTLTKRRSLPWVAP